MLGWQIADEAPRVWLIDRRGRWRGEVRRALCEAGFETRAWEEYDYPPSDSEGQSPDLVVVSGTVIGELERLLIRRVLDLAHPLVVVSGHLTGPQILELLRAGAVDAAEIPPDQERVVSLVRDSLRYQAPVSSYEAVARGMTFK